MVEGNPNNMASLSKYIYVINVVILFILFTPKEHIKLSGLNY